MMRCLVARFEDQKLEVGTAPLPVPGKGEVLVRVLACGICGTDLHLLQHGKDMGMKDCTFGHEFVCEVVELGPETAGVAPGDRVCSMPILPVHGDPDFPPPLLGASPLKNGAMAEYMLLSAGLCHKVPPHVSDEHAALTEPMAVAVHSVNQCLGDPKHTIPVVYGCGPVGLCTILVLKARGFHPVIAVQRSVFRRELAAKLGADIVIDPTNPDTSPMDVWREEQAKKLGKTVAELKVMERGNYSHCDWGLVWEKVSDEWRPPVIFENVGVPNMLESIVRDVPRHTLIVVCGLCMQPDTIHHEVFMAKEAEIKFVLGYEGSEFRQALELVASGKLALDPLITSTVSLEEAPSAFQELQSSSGNAKVIVKPGAKSCSGGYAVAS